MTSFRLLQDGTASLALGLAIVLVSCIPIWALLLWMAVSSLSWRWRAEMSWKRFLVPMAGFSAVIAGGYGWSWAGGLFARSRPVERNVIYWVWIVQLFLAGIAVIVVASARAAPDAIAASEVCRKPRRCVGAVTLAWGALALVLGAMRAWRLRDGAARLGDWCALAVSSAVLVALMTLLIVAVVDLRADMACRRSVVPRKAS